MQVGAQQGWQCPLCKRIYGPFVQECYNCNNREGSILTTTEDEEKPIFTIDWTKSVSKTSQIPTFYKNIDGKL